MDIVKKLSLLLAVTTLVACNEKVAPELKNSGVTDGSSSGGTTSSTEYYVKVTNTSPTLLNYQLHRTGPGNYNKECKISSTGVAFSNGLYTSEANATPSIDHDDKQFDISCYFDMEEQGLYSNGFKFKIEASPNTCAYIGYSPFSFYERQPGDSSTSITRVKCVNTDPGTAAAEMTSKFPTVAQDSAGSTITCNQSKDTGLAKTQGTDLVFPTPVDSKGYCIYDYSSQVGNAAVKAGKNCDPGKITLREITFTTALDTTTGTNVTTNTEVFSQIDCGGKIEACIAGPMTEIGTDATRYTEQSPTIENEVFSKEYSYSGRLSSGTFPKTSVYYANFRSTLSNSLIDYQDYTVDADQFVWSTDGERKKYDPEVMTYYANNRHYKQGTNIITSSDWTAATVATGRTARPYAADPFLGLGGYTTSPFYTVYCFDSAYDVKGRIRIAVREWDRTFTKSIALENITDYIGRSTSPNLVSRQDNPTEQEIPGNPDQYNSYDDLADWDDYIPMVRASTVPVEWQPITTDLVTYPRGYFDPAMYVYGRY